MHNWHIPSPNTNLPLHFSLLPTVRPIDSLPLACGSSICACAEQLFMSSRKLTLNGCAHCHPHRASRVLFPPLCLSSPHILQGDVWAIHRTLIEGSPEPWNHTLGQFRWVISRAGSPILMSSSEGHCPLGLPEPTTDKFGSSQVKGRHEFSRLTPQHQNKLMRTTNTQS